MNRLTAQSQISGFIPQPRLVGFRLSAFQRFSLSAIQRFNIFSRRLLASVVRRPLSSLKFHPSALPSAVLRPPSSVIGLPPSVLRPLLPALRLLLFCWAACHLGAATEPLAVPAPAPSATNSPALSGAALPAATPNPIATPDLTASPVRTMETLDDKHKLAIGDRLSFRIIEDEEDPKPLVVTDSGELEVPYIGRFPAVDKTCRQLARELKTELEKDYYIQATVIIAVDVMARSRGKVYLVGPVRLPGPQEIPSDEILTLSKAILRAGGFNDLADRKSVRVTRKSATGGDNQTFTVNVGEIIDKGQSNTDLPLEPGDVILIPARLIRF